MSLATTPEPAIATSPERTGAILRRLTALHPKAIDLSLGRLLALLDKLGSPHRQVPPVVHLAGTNGKGSTIAYMRAALEAAGQQVHIYISPHLVRFNERIRLAGSLIDDALLIEVLDEAERINDGAPITLFEITTAAAFLAFARVPADILLLETGLGGRLDATNVIDAPALTAISPISLDHQQFLGEDIATIAAEKAGILKPGVPAVIGPQCAAAAAAIAFRADRIGAPLFAAGDRWQIAWRHDALQYRSNALALDLPAPVLDGVHQIDNAGLALACLEVLGRQRAAWRCDVGHLAAGLRHARWPGRLQRLRRGPLIARLPDDVELWLDGGHNPAAGAAVATTLAARRCESGHGGELVLVFGMLETKDPAGYLAPFRPLEPRIIAIEVPDEPASLSADAILAVARDLGFAADRADSVEAAIARIARERHEAMRGPSATPMQILICGSLYLAGAVLAANG